MENKIQEVYNYFKEKIISGDYIVIEKEKLAWSVIIDGKYKFDLWIGGNWDMFSVGGIFTEAFMTIEFTDDEKKLAWASLEPLLTEWEHLQGLPERKKKYEELKKEFEG